ncbi:hypothetical protein FN846DRAFT_889678 [Sphaerosporella brunnea]|uniref:Uncharacterized protein n=1 Tax=Sphaerosporella brunnea TaxID=1250544 RepID=A0A5J5EZ10_9PEZI|nr:hypothetical protein FN846DRAFT_889678 [Sphaerosporella brunnea]
MDSELDGAAGSNSEPDAEVIAAPARGSKKRKRATPSNKVAKEYHIVRCCHCTKVWGPFAASMTTTSMFNRHIETHHKKLPTDDVAEKDVLQRLAAQYHGNRTKSIPTTSP